MKQKIQFIRVQAYNEKCRVFVLHGTVFMMFMSSEGISSTARFMTELTTIQTIQHELSHMKVMLYSPVPLKTL